MLKNNVRRVAKCLALGLAGILALSSTANAQMINTEVDRALFSSTDQRNSIGPEGGSKIVVFGDSQTSSTGFPKYVDERGCQVSFDSWPRFLREELGLPEDQLIDVACSGSTINSGQGFHFSDQVRDAEAQRALGVNTEHIFIQLGFNDHWGTPLNYTDALANCLLDLAAGCGDRAVTAGKVLNPGSITKDSYVQRIKPVIDYLEYYYPEAEITFVGYPELVTNSHEICFIVAGQRISKPDAPAIAQFFLNLNTAQREAATELGFDYIDVPQLTAGHGPCAADPWVSGFFAMPDLLGGLFHTTTVGDKVIASAIATKVRS